MKTGRKTIIILLLLLPGIVLLNQIVSVRLLEMQYQIQRDRFLNFELSSQLLIVRMKDLARQRSSMKDEISASVLETGVINQIEQEFRSPTLLERLTVHGINVIRLFSLKPMLHLESGPGSIKVLQVAFYFERTRHYPSAVRTYQTMLNELEPSSDSQAFALLHLGFCYVVTGEIEEALRLLERVRSDHPGTHFGETADTLIRMILEGDRQAKTIENANMSVPMKARKLAEIGRCKSALTYFGKTSIDDPEDQFIRAKCLEQTGITKEAILAYRDLVRRGSPELRKKASRRLMVTGEFYGGGKEARRYAEQAMESDGDREGLQIMADADADRKEDLSNTDDTDDLPASVKEEMARNREEQQSFRSLFPDKPERRQPVFLPDNYEIFIEAFGGRTIRLHSSVLDAVDLEGLSGGLRIRILLQEIRRISPGAERQRLRIFLRDGSSFVSDQLLTDAESGFRDPQNSRPIRFGQIVRIMGERK